MRIGKFIYIKVWMVGVMLVSCTQSSDMVPPVATGQGLLTLTLNADADFTTRAVTESKYRNTDNYTIVVTDKDGVEKMNCKGVEVSSKMPLVMDMGGYSVRAFYGTEHDASRDEFYVFGEAQGNIKAGEKETVGVVCTPTCGRITVNFDSRMSTFFCDYNVVFSGTAALGTNTIAWTKEDTEPWYVRLEEDGEDISFIITTVTKEEYIHSGSQQQTSIRKGSFKLSRNRGYKMNISANYIPTDVSNVDIKITIDGTTNDKHVDIEVPVEWM